MLRLLILFFIILFSANSFAMEGNSQKKYLDDSKKLEKSECGKAIEEFKKFQVLAKRCDRETDCIVLEGRCPLGCNFYLHRIFEDIFLEKVENVTNICGQAVCSNKCPKSDKKPICKNKRCVAG
ncbi:MAG: hypothetical protein SFT90_08315 [Rickettsiales bacterium]|nr:hypothetical protein [Rickettsiales bacterium]